MDELAEEKKNREALQNTLLRERNALANVNSLLREERRKGIMCDNEVSHVLKIYIY